MSRSRPGHDDISFEEAAALIGLDDDLDEVFGAKPIAMTTDVVEKPTLLGRRITIVIERVDDRHDEPMEPTIRVALLGYLLGLAENTAGKAAEEHFNVNVTTKMVVRGLSFEVETSNEDQKIGGGGPVDVR